MKLFIALVVLGKVAAECPNACSGHGSCGAYDECTCYANWQGGDCGYRTCPFSLSHVDSPKGDLDGSADTLSGIDTIVIVDSTVYPFGTTEQYPAMVDSLGTELTQTAHDYSECGNKGLCNRKAGECECFDGYEGAACQRASCPDITCSGHGTCHSAAQLAYFDNQNEYKLWDKDVTMGCLCEPGYQGPSCADKMCKYGVDPLYDDDYEREVRYASARVEIDIVNDLGENLRIDYKLAGTYAIKFYDVFGEDFKTLPIMVNSNCSTVVDALEALPNTVIPADSVTCLENQTLNNDKIAYDLMFTGNPGELMPIEVDMYLDGNRPTVYLAHNENNTVVQFNVQTTVYPNYYGISGEFTDYFSTICSGVVLSMEALSEGITKTPDAGSRGMITGLSTAENKLLKKCLGDANGDTSDNVDVFDWDYGLWNTTLTPHIVKISPSSKETLDDAGKFYLLWYNDAEYYEVGGYPGVFYTGNLPPVDDDLDSLTGYAENYDIFTTSGVATVLSNSTYTQGAEFGTQDALKSEAVTGRWAEGDTTVYTSKDVSCYSGNMGDLNVCLEKGDIVFLFDSNWPKRVTLDGAEASLKTTPAADTGTMYTVVKIGVNEPTSTTYDMEDRFYFVVDKVINWDGSDTVTKDELQINTNEYTAHNDLGHYAQLVGHQQIIKFVPGETGNYNYVQQCSGRGLCDYDSGLCQCFSGYTNDNCDLQSALAV